MYHRNPLPLGIALAVISELKDESGKILTEGERQVQDRTFMFGTASTDPASLRYDRELFRKWLRPEFWSFRQ
jgi:hypothetical protein